MGEGFGEGGRGLETELLRKQYLSLQPLLKTEPLVVRIKEEVVSMTPVVTPQLAK